MLGASALLSAMAALVKALAPRLPAMELVFFRSLLALPLLYLLVRRKGASLLPVNRWLVSFRAFSGTAAMFLYFWGLGQMPLADGMIIGKVQPLLIALLAPLLLHERVKGGVWLAALLSFAGVWLILEPTLRVGELGGVAFLASALFSALAHMSLRRLSVADGPMVIVWSFTLITTVITAPLMLADFVMPTALEWLALFAIALLGTLGQLLMTRAYAVEEASVVSASGYSGVLWGVFWGFILWGEAPGTTVWLGGALVVLGGMALLWLRRGLGPRDFSLRPTSGG